MTAAPFTVLPTLHGPEGWFDVVDTKAGHTVAVCPKKCFAKQVAEALEKKVTK